MATFTTTVGATAWTAPVGTSDSYVVYGLTTAGDTITGGDAADTIYGLAGVEKIDGGAGADYIVGGAGDDATLTGGAGNDTFVWNSGDGSDTISDLTTSGAPGKDVIKLVGINQSALSYTTATANGTINLGGGQTITTTAAKSANIVTADNTFYLALGTDGATAQINGTTGVDYLQAGTLKDTLDGKGGADTLIGAAGDDTIYYYADSAKVDGAAGTDTLSALTSATAGVSIDLRNTKYTNIENVVGSTFGDWLAGTAGNDTLDGNAGADTLWGGVGADSLIGGTGNDTYWFGAGDGADSLAATADADVYNLYGAKFSDLALAYAGGNLTVTVGAAANNDVLTITGAATGNGVNIFKTTDKTFTVIANAAAGANLIGTAGNDYILNTDGGGDSLFGGLSGADTLIGGAGADTLYFSNSLATANGGAGSDIISAANVSGAVTIDLRDTKFTNIEKVVGNDSGDLLIGSTGANTLTGGTGADNVWGATGADSLVGGTGKDTYWFGTGDGADALIAAAEADTYNFYNVKQSEITFGYAAGVLTATVGNALNGDALTINGYGVAGIQGTNVFQTTDATFKVYADVTGGVALTGSAGTDLVQAFGAADTLSGGTGGADTLVGAAGTDSLVYSASLAKVDGGAANDTLTAAAATAGVTIDLRNTKYTNIETIVGSNNGDLLIGSTGNDTITGGTVASNIWGAAGNDTLAGGAGADTYWFSFGDGNDTIAAAATAAGGLNDVVKLYGITDGAAMSSYGLVNSAADLQINLTDGSSLTLTGWAGAGEGRINKFDFGTSGVWSYTNTTNSWTKVS